MLNNTNSYEKCLQNNNLLKKFFTCKKNINMPEYQAVTKMSVFFEKYLHYMVMGHIVAFLSG